MARSYSTTFKNVAISAAQDLISLKNPSAVVIVKIVRWYLAMTDTTIQTAQGIYVNGKFSTATFTAGSGGAAGTVNKLDQGDGSAVATTRTNDTAQGTTSGAFSFPWSGGGHNYASPDWTLKSPIVVSQNEGFVFELLSTVSGTCHFSGYLEWTEEGG